MNKMKRIISPILLVSAAMIWGFAFSAQKAAEAVPAFTLGAVRSIFATFFLVAAVIIKDIFSGSERRIYSLKKSSAFNKNEIIGGIICGAVMSRKKK